MWHRSTPYELTEQAGRKLVPCGGFPITRMPRSVIFDW